MRSGESWGLLTPFQGGLRGQNNFQSDTERQSAFFTLILSRVYGVFSRGHAMGDTTAGRTQGQT